MIDVAKSRGIDIKAEKLSEFLGVPVIPTVARNGKGKTELMDAAVSVIREKNDPDLLKISYGDDIDSLRAFGEDAVTSLCQRLLAEGAPGLHFYSMNQVAPTMRLWKNLDIS